MAIPISFLMAAAARAEEISRPGSIEIELVARSKGLSIEGAYRPARGAERTYSALLPWEKVDEAASAGILIDAVSQVYAALEGAASVTTEATESRQMRGSFHKSIRGEGDNRG